MKDSYIDLLLCAISLILFKLSDIDLERVLWGVVMVVFAIYYIFDSIKERNLRR